LNAMNKHIMSQFECNEQAYFVLVNVMKASLLCS